MAPTNHVLHHLKQVSMKAFTNYISHVIIGFFQRKISTEILYINKSCSFHKEN